MPDEMQKVITSPLFRGIQANDLRPMLQCLGYHVATYQKGECIALEAENTAHIGIILSGAVDMIKEDFWGNKTTFMRLKTQELFGETFTCGSDSRSMVAFWASADAKILFLPFDRVMHTCSMTCVFHHRLIENMVVLIANKNRELMQKIEVISQNTLR